MTEHPHEDIRRLFDMVLDAPAAQRGSVLDRACAGDEGLKQRIRAMIAAAEDDQFLSNATGGGLDDVTMNTLPECDPSSSPHESVGQVIGRYKLLEQIGEGGFGSVWAAEQKEPVRRRVALKIIKLGMDTKQVIARFGAERQALAMMDHPNIAKIFDAGVTETGRPYFVMEYIKGVPILEYCDTERIGTKARLDLFTRVCHAIQHAHQKGIIHRDIKPGNVLVTMHDGVPVPKVIDFGIAKATNHELTEQTVFTQHRQMIGTPVYMSPEQAEMSGLDIDTRSDIYSLGVLLYELLTGTTPFDQKELLSRGFGEMMRIIREETPHKPSTRLSTLGDTGTRTANQRQTDIKKLNLALKGDLDWIVMKCLEKDRTRRYDTANGLAADIVRHLGNEPVTAGPPSAKYKMAKFVKRNKGQVVAGGAIAALLVVGVVGTSYGMVWALSEKGRADEQATLAMAAAESERVAKLEAEENAQRAEAAEAEALARAEELELVADFQAGQLSAIEPEVMGANLRRSLIGAALEAERDALAAALARINFTSLALSTLEDNIFERTIEAIDSQFESQPLVRARLLQTVANTLRKLGLLDLATDPQVRALAIRREQLGDDHPDTLISIGNMGALLLAQGKPAEAEPYSREALESNRRVLGDEHPHTLTSLNNMGLLLQAQGKLAEAEPYCREALEGSRRVLGDDHPSTLNSIGSVAVLLWSQGKLAEAEPYHREAIEGNRRVLGDDHPSTLIFINTMGRLLRDQGKPAEAEPYYREALEGSRRVLGDDHPDTLTSLNSMGVLLLAQGKLAETEPYLREAIEGNRRVLGDDHPSTLMSIGNMGSLLRSLGKLAEAEPYFREAIEGHRRVLGDDHPDTLVAVSNLSLLLSDLARGGEALELADEAVATGRRVLGIEHWLIGNFLGKRGRALQVLGRYGEGAEAMLEAHANLTAALGQEHEQPRRVVGHLADLYKAWDKAEPDAGHDATAAEWRGKLEAEGD